MQDDKKKDKKGLMGMFSGMGGFSGWIQALMGKPRTTQVQPSEISENQIAEEKPQEEKTVQEDSVKEDLEKFKALFKKGVKNVSVSSQPLKEKTKEAGSVIAGGAKSAFAGKFVNNIVRIFLIIVFLMILLFIGMRLFRTVKEEGGGKLTTPDAIETPTPFSYQPYKPSVYTEDPEILELEEEINILERELSTVGLREDKLTPPTLDYNINFK